MAELQSEDRVESHDVRKTMIEHRQDRDIFDLGVCARRLFFCWMAEPQSEDRVRSHDVEKIMARYSDKRCCTVNVDGIALSVAGNGSLR